MDTPKMDTPMTRRMNVIALVTTFLFATAPSPGQADAVLIERAGPMPSGFYRSTIYGSDIPTYLYPRFHYTSVVAFSHPVVAPSFPAFARIEETTTAAYIVMRDTRSGDSIASYTVPRGSSNLHWNRFGNIVFEVPPKDGIGALVAKEPYTGRTVDSTTVTRQYMPQSGPSQGACLVAPTASRFAFIRISTEGDGVANIPMPAYQDVGSPIARYPIPPYTTARVNGREEQRVLVACGPSVPRPMRHLSWSASSTLIAFYGIVTFDRPFPTDPTRTYRVGSEGIFVIDIFSREVREIRTTKNVALENPDQFFFAPAGWMLAYKVRPDGGQPRVFLSNAQEGGAGNDLGEGTFITGPTSDLVWHCSPWSRTGGRLIIHRNDGSIYTRPPCGADLVIMDGSSQQLWLLSAQSADVDARPFTLSTMVLDPWPDLINNTGRIRNDAWMMLPRTHIVRGCAADGASRLVLRIAVPQWMTDEVSVSLLPENCAEGVQGDIDKDGSLSSVGLETRLSQTSIKPRIENGVGICGVVYNAPEDFVSETADTMRTVRTIRLSVSARDIQTFVDIEIVRPPLILVHGIWSSSALFDKFEPITSASKSDQRFNITRLDFSGQSSKPVDNIIGSWGTGIPARLESAITGTYSDHVAVRGDVVGHSLGPVLMRYMAATRLPSVFTRRNGGMGHVHKLISMDSPHLGSQFCAIVADAVVNNPVRAALLDDALSAFVVNGIVSDPATGGIVGDLRPTSAFVTVSAFPDFIAIQPRLHTIESVATKAQEKANDYLISLIDVIVGLDLSSNTFSEIFGGAPNDLMVTRNSQTAGLLFDNVPDRTTIIDGFVHSDGFSDAVGVVNPASGAAKRVIELLHASSNSDLFSSRSESFPLSLTNSTIDNVPVPLLSPALQDPTPRITITGPPPETTIAPGTTQTLTIEPVSGTTLQKVILVYRGKLLVDSLAPFIFDCYIPLNSPLGPLRFVALGIVDDTTSTDLSAQLLLDVQGPNSCSELYFTGDSVLSLDNIHVNQRLSVAAMFYDGHQRYVELDRNTSFVSRDTNVCVVKDGWVQMRGQGATNVVTRRCELSDSIRVVCTNSDLPPIADAGADTLLLEAGICAISALRSRDPEGSPLTYTWWVQVAPPLVTVTIAEPTAPVTTATFGGNGLAVVGLDVADSTGKHDTAWKFIRVGPATSVQHNQPTYNDILVYPNPSSDVVHILHPNVAVSVEMFVADMLGIHQRVDCNRISERHCSLDIRSLSPGVYHFAMSPMIRAQFTVVR